MEILEKLLFNIKIALLAYKLKVVCYTTFFQFICFFFCVLINCKQIDIWFFILISTFCPVFCLQFKSNYFANFQENHLI